MAKLIFDCKDGRTFEIHTNPDFHGAMAEYSISEVIRPKWKIFRTRYCTSGCFWLSDYKDIREGLLVMLGKYLTEEEEAEANRKKWQELEKSA